MSFLWGSKRTTKIEEDMASLEKRVTTLEEEILPLLKNIDKRTATLENHMSHIVAEAFSNEQQNKTSS